jgi:hypothetical protein
MFTVIAINSFETPPWICRHTVYTHTHTHTHIYIYVKTKKVHSYRLLTKFSVPSKPRIWMDLASFQTCTCETVMPFVRYRTDDHNLPICWFTQVHYSAQHVVPYHKYIKLSYERLMSVGFQPSNQNKSYCNYKTELQMQLNYNFKTPQERER